MSQKQFLDEILKNRQEFLSHLRQDLNQTEDLLRTTTEKISSLNETVSTIKTLSEKVEHETLLPLGKKIYVNGVIKHTSEFFLDHPAHPNSYSSYETLENTLELLQNRISREQELLTKGENSRKQLEERINLLQINDSPSLAGQELPNQIVSDRGVAVKVGDFYEIVEYEN